MPIQFRCEHCQQLLSISRRKAGRTTVCPSCLEEVPVPTLDAGEGEEAAEGLIAKREAAAGGAGETRRGTRPVDSEDEDEEDEDWNPSRKRHQENDAIDMTAMVDVTFLLLIFFMVTASFAAQKVLETSPPQEQEQAEEAGAGGGAPGPTIEDLEESSVIVEVDGQDRITVDGKAVAGIHELREVLNQKLVGEQKTEVLIQAQYEAKHGTVVSITDTAMDVGMQRVRRLSRKGDP